MEIIRYSSIDSTNAKAKELAKKETEPWTVIWAEEQKEGYGRKRESWFSPPGGLYFSIILPKQNKNVAANLSRSNKNSKKSFEETRLKVRNIQTLTILAAFMVGKVIKEEFGLEAFIKIPNDVWVNQKKLAGVLTENVVGKNIKSSVIGIGINTNIENFPPDLKDDATSLKIELGKKTNNKKILEKIVKGLEEQFKILSL